MIWKRFEIDLKLIWKEFENDLKMIWRWFENDSKEFEKNLKMIWRWFENDLKEFEKNLKMILLGYQRQLLFKHYDKSYSAFGDTDASGSTFLTAFVARSFQQAKDFITIDQDIISGAVDWLINNQAENGSFPEVGKVFDRELQGGAGKGTALTAYVLITLLETQSLGNYSSNITNAVKYLESEQKIELFKITK